MGNNVKNRMRYLSAAVFAFSVAGSAVATEYFVDCNRPDDSGEGTSEATAKRTIQAAVDKAVEGDVVTVLPGYYTAGGKVEGGGMNRVYFGVPGVT